MEEIWKSIPGHEGRYEVSNFGRVRSRLWSGHVLAQRATQYGYVRVILTEYPRRPTFHHVHKLVLEAFVGPRPEGMQTRHLDGNRKNNRLVNLAWGTQRENNLDTIRHGNHKNVAKTHCPAGHPYDETNTYWRRRGRYMHRQCRECGRESARRYQAQRRTAAVA